MLFLEKLGWKVQGLGNQYFREYCGGWPWEATKNSSLWVQKSVICRSSGQLFRRSPAGEGGKGRGVLATISAHSSRSQGKRQEGWEDWESSLWHPASVGSEGLEWEAVPGAPGTAAPMGPASTAGCVSAGSWVPDTPRAQR